MCRLWDFTPFTDHCADDLVEHFRVNVVVCDRYLGGMPGTATDICFMQGPFLASKAFLPALSLAKVGKIINITSDVASIAGKLVVTQQGVDCVS